MCGGTAPGAQAADEATGPGEVIRSWSVARLGRAAGHETLAKNRHRSAPKGKSRSSPTASTFARCLQLYKGRLSLPQLAHGRDRFRTSSCSPSENSFCGSKSVYVWTDNAGTEHEVSNRRLKARRHRHACALRRPNTQGLLWSVHRSPRRLLCSGNCGTGAAAKARVPSLNPACANYGPERRREAGSAVSQHHFARQPRTQQRDVSVARTRARSMFGAAGSVNRELLPVPEVLARGAARVQKGRWFPMTSMQCASLTGTSMFMSAILCSSRAPPSQQTQATACSSSRALPTQLSCGHPAGRGGLGR